MEHILILGGSSRIGLKVANILSERKTGVTCLDKVRSPLLRSDIAFVQCDLDSAQNFNSVVAQIRESSFGSPSGLVNFVRAPREPASSTPSMSRKSVQFLSELNINAVAPYLFVDEILRIVVSESKNFSIVNISSVLANFVTMAEAAAYHASKAAVEALTRYQAVEYAKKNVKSNALRLGFVANKNENPINTVGETLERVLVETSLAEVEITPLQIANVIMFLLSAESIGLTGQILTLDSGYSLQEHLGLALKAQH